MMKKFEDLKQKIIQNSPFNKKKENKEEQINDSKDFEIIQESQDDGRIFTTENSVSGWVYVSDSQQNEPQELNNQQWEIIIKQRTFQNFHMRDIYFSLYKGISQDIRKNIWPILIEKENLIKKTKVSYQDLKNQVSIDDEQILKDVPRTNQQIPLFKSPQGKQIMFNILRAYSNLDKETGYVQGMNSIAAGLIRLVMTNQNDELLNFGINQGNEQINQEQKNEKNLEIKQINQNNEDCIEQIEVQRTEKNEQENIEESEENVFWLLVFILQERQWKSVFEIGTPGLKKCLNKLKKLMERFTPKIYKHILDIENEYMPGGLLFDMLFIPYYFTLMLFDTPRQISQTILDLFLLDGESIIHGILLKMIQNSESEILDCSIDEIRQFFQNQILKQTDVKNKSQSRLMSCLADNDLNFFIDQEINYI